MYVPDLEQGRFLVRIFAHRCLPRKRGNAIIPGLVSGGDYIQVF